MKSNSVLLLVIAMVCGLTAAYLVAKFTGGGSGDEMEDVLVANQQIKQSTKLDEPEKYFVAVKRVKGTTKGAVTLDQLKGKMVNKTVQVSQHVTADDLNDNLGLVAPPDHVSMAIKVTPETAVGGFILPGSRVNVMLATKESNQRSEVQTILQNILVLAIDTTKDRPEGGAAVAQLNTATLAVLPKDAQRLALARSKGELSLALRNAGDVKRSSLSGITKLDTDDGAVGGDAEVVLPRVLVAKEDIAPGTEIDDPEKFFTTKIEMKPADKALKASDLESLKGKKMMKEMLKDTVVLSRHFEGLLPVAPTAPKKDIHVMFLHSGGRAPQSIVFENNQQVGADGTALPTPTTPSNTPTTTTPPPVPPTPPQGAAATPSAKSS